MNTQLLTHVDGFDNDGPDGVGDSGNNDTDENDNSNDQRSVPSVRHEQHLPKHNSRLHVQCDYKDGRNRRRRLIQLASFWIVPVFRWIQMSDTRHLQLICVSTISFLLGNLLSTVMTLSNPFTLSTVITIIIVGEFIGVILSKKRPLEVSSAVLPSEILYSSRGKPQNQEGQPLDAASGTEAVRTDPKGQQRVPTLRSIDFSWQINVSRILGIIGSPPIKWIDEPHLGDNDDKLLDGKSIDVEDISNKTRSYPNDSGIDSDTNNNSKCENSSDDILCFFEAHARLILTVDEFYYWMKVTTGLHFGLGPQSQCVERVAELAKLRAKTSVTSTTATWRTTKTTTATATETETPSNDEKQTRIKTALSPSHAGRDDNIVHRLTPQHRISPGKILPLASSRRSVATILVNQSKSIMKILKILKNIDPKGNKQVVDCNAIHDDIDDDQALLEPSIVDLAWFKAARRQVTTMLTRCADAFISLSTEPGTYSSPNDGNDVIATSLQISLHESTKSATRSIEYIQYNILFIESSQTQRRTLSKTSLPTVVPFRDNLRGTYDESKPFLLLLMRYQEYMEGVRASIRAIQEEYIKSNVEDKGNDEQETGGDRKVITDDVDKTAVEHWWNESRRWNAALHSIEEEIDRRLPLSSNEIELKNDFNKNIPNCKNDSSQDTLTLLEFRHDGIIRSTTSKEKPQFSHSIKTQVFKGNGSVEPLSRKINTAKESSQGGGHRTTVSVDWSRDTISERLLVEELQQRIVSLMPGEEDIEEHETGSIETVSSHNDNGMPDDSVKQDWNTIHDDGDDEEHTCGDLPTIYAPVMIPRMTVDGTAFLSEIHGVINANNQQQMIEQEEEDGIAIHIFE